MDEPQLQQQRPWLNRYPDGVPTHLDLTRHASLADLLEGVVMHAFANKPPFSDTTLQRIEQLKDVYGMAYGVEMSHRLTEADAPNE